MRIMQEYNFLPGVEVADYLTYTLELGKRCGVKVRQNRGATALKDRGEGKMQSNEESSPSFNKKGGRERRARKGGGRGRSNFDDDSTNASISSGTMKSSSIISDSLNINSNARGGEKQRAHFGGGEGSLDDQQSDIVFHGGEKIKKKERGDDAYYNDEDEDDFSDGIGSESSFSGESTDESSDNDDDDDKSIRRRTRTKSDTNKAKKKAAAANPRGGSGGSGGKKQTNTNEGTAEYSGSRPRRQQQQLTRGKGNPKKTARHKLADKLCLGANDPYIDTYLPHARADPRGAANVSVAKKKQLKRRIVRNFKAAGHADSIRQGKPDDIDKLPALLPLPQCYATGPVTGENEKSYLAEKIMRNLRTSHNAEGNDSKDAVVSLFHRVSVDEGETYSDILNRPFFFIDPRKSDKAKCIKREHRKGRLVAKPSTSD
jgi:hypothetical protein